jgi:hypothetical protein
VEYGMAKDLKGRRKSGGMQLLNNYDFVPYQGPE